MAEQFVYKEVCKICFNASSQKANPTLTPVEKVVNESGRKVCPNCRQPWSSQKVAKDMDQNRWVQIRSRPLKMNPHIDYQLCTSVLKKQPCPKGHGICTFAHSRAELISWNRDRYRDPRPVPSGVMANQVSMCKHVMADSQCPYGQRCVYAHSEEEREKWIDELAGVKGNSFGGGNQNSDFYCHACNISCTGQRQYEEHLSGQRHRQIVAAQSPVASIPHPVFVAPPPMHQLYHHPVAPRMQQQHQQAPLLPHPHIRQMPDRLPANGFRMCISMSTSRGCFYGPKCTFAHSEAELDAWNKQVMELRERRIAAGSIQSHMQPPRTHGDLDEFEGEKPVMVPEQGDFAHRIRTTVMLDYQEKESGKDLLGFEKTLQNVTITEVTCQEEAMTVSDNIGTVSWQFEVSATSPKTLQSVVLFDMLAPEYSIEEVNLVMYGGRIKPLVSQATPSQGSGLYLAQRITPPDKVNVKIVFKPRSGVLGQMVIFDFGNFYMIRYLCVHVINEQDKRLLAPSTQRKFNNRPEKPDYFWDQTYTLVEMGGMEVRETGDEKLPEHQLPKVIEGLIEQGKYDNMQRKIAQKTYVRRMHNLLYLEEFQERKDLSRYDLYDIELFPKDYYQTVGELIADPRYSFVTLEMDEVLFEGGRSIRPSDYVMMVLKPSGGQSELHRCMVHQVMRDSVAVKMSKRTAEACNQSGNRASVRFQPSRIAMRSMHEGLDKVDLTVIFPDSNSVSDKSPTPLQSLSRPLRECMGELDHSVLNEEQKNAVRSVLDPAYRNIPTLVLGPFGCGKTKALLECVKLLSLYDSNARILVCTHNNSAADIYVKAIHEEFMSRRRAKAPMLRLYYSERNPLTVDPEVRSYCKLRNEKFYNVDATELGPYTIIVTTTITARMLWLNGVDKGHFTHILIDEAAQVLEAELLIPLCLAGKNTKIALAGDDMQMEPPVHSPYAKKYGLDVSLIERLCDDDVYSKGPTLRCKVHLTENHRSHYDILYLPSKLFYDNKLVCKAVFPVSGPKHIPNLQFVGVDGHEAQEEHSPSYYNDQEVFKIAEEVNLFYDGGRGLQPNEICVLSYYELQVKRIRSYLRNRGFSKVEVQRIEGIQGKEYRALIVSTVRTCSTAQDGNAENEDGFLNNIKFFNTAITRAKEWLVIVGEPITLCTVGYNTACWMELIENCIQKKTFRYQCADMFMKFLETRVISRQIMQKQHGDFLKKSTAPTQASKIIAPPATSESSDVRQTTSQMASLNVSYQQQAIKDTVLKCMQTPDESLATKIYGEVMKLSTPQLNVFITQPEAAAKYIRELENAMKRGGLTSVLMNNARLQPPNVPENTVPAQQPQKNPLNNNTVANVMGDLPVFLQNQVESLTQHLRYCDSQKCFTQAEVQNLTEQKSLLLQQMQLVNQQILKYREYVKLSTTATTSQPQLSHNSMMAPLMQTMNPLTNNPMSSQIPQHLHSNNPQMMYGASATQPVGNMSGMVQQSFYRPEGFSGGFNPNVSLLQQQQQQQPMTAATSIQPGGINSLQHQQPAMNQFGIGLPGSTGGGFMNSAGLMPPQMQHQMQQSSVQYNPVMQNTQQAGMKVNFQDSFLHQSQPTVRQTTQLISPLSNLAASQTWNGDEDID